MADKMGKFTTTNNMKILKFTRRLKNQVVQTFLHMSPEDTAYYFVNVAGEYERGLINKALQKAPVN